jgi:hypothetical protein
MLNPVFARVCAVALGVCLLTSASRAADEEMVDNPQYKSWARHKVGSSVTHEMTSSVGGQNFKSTITNKLAELTPEKAVLEVATKLDIAGVPPQPAQKIEVAAKVKKSEAAAGQMPPGVKGEVKDKGTEKVSVGGKSYTCKVQEFTGESQGVKMKGKTWSSDEVPGTLVKMESTANASGQDMKSSMALTKVEVK